MAIKFVVAHRVDPNNVGDMASNPMLYFGKGIEYQTIDIIKLGKQPYPEDVPLIVGGGGLIGNNFIGDPFLELLDSSDRLRLDLLSQEVWKLSNPAYKEYYDDWMRRFNDLIREAQDRIKPMTAPRFIWGAGHNSEAVGVDFNDIKWPKSFGRYRSIGIRDYDERSKYTWVPCPSCMHPAFDKQYAIKNDIIWFEHKKQLIKATDFGSEVIPRFVNSGNNFEQTIELLGSANIVLTNSYHGVYWATLLGKKVIVPGGQWSTKFQFFKHPPTFVGKKEDWRDYVEQARTYPNALAECRRANTTYWENIKAICS